MFRILLLLFIAVPLLEIYFLIQIGTQIGAWPTIALVLFTAFLGAGMLRAQGIATLVRIREALDRGELPAQSLVEGLLLLISGALLLTPGFFTDGLGFICLMPPVRRALAKTLLRGVFAVRVHKAGERQTGGHRTLEGEYWEEEDQ